MLIEANFRHMVFRTHLHDIEVIVVHLRNALKEESGAGSRLICLSAGLIRKLISEPGR